MYLLLKSRDKNVNTSSRFCADGILKSVVCSGDGAARRVRTSYDFGKFNWIEFFIERIVSIPNLGPPRE